MPKRIKANLNLTIKPNNAPIAWQTFCDTHPPFSIALDGYVREAPKFSRKGPWANFNHHEDVDRLATRSTCAQILIAIRQGLFDCFQENNTPIAHVFVNDCDEDVCLSWYLIKNFFLIEQEIPAPISKLVIIEDLLDATAGAYPFKIRPSELQNIEWNFDPYRRFSLNGGLENKRVDEYQDILNKIERRIKRYLNGKGGKVVLDTRYKKIGGSEEWVLLEEIGAHGRTGAYMDGVRAYVAVRPKSKNHWVYTIGRMSPFVPFHIGKIIRHLNKIEGNKEDLWGGANTIGGSPRVNGSKIPPKDLEKLINDIIKD